MDTQEQKESDLIDTICKCRRGSMDDKQFRATVEHVLSQAIQTEREANVKGINEAKNALIDRDTNLGMNEAARLAYETSERIVTGKCIECGEDVEQENRSVGIPLCKKCDKKNWITNPSEIAAEIATDPDPRIRSLLSSKETNQ